MPTVLLRALLTVGTRLLRCLHLVLRLAAASPSASSLRSVKTGAWDAMYLSLRSAEALTLASASRCTRRIATTASSSTNSTAHAQSLALSTSTQQAQQQCEDGHIAVVLAPTPSRCASQAEHHDAQTAELQDGCHQRRQQQQPAQPQQGLRDQFTHQPSQHQGSVAPVSRQQPYFTAHAHATAPAHGPAMATTVAHGIGNAGSTTAATSDEPCSAPRPWFMWPLRPATTSLLPPQQGPPRMTLVLDLDQTLIECLHLKCERVAAPDFVYTDCHGLQANVWQRPHLMQFLKAVSRDFEVVLFTAAAQRHADAVLGIVDPLGELVHHRLYGHHTVAAPRWAWVKDLGRLGRDLSKTLIVDDCSMAALFHLGNWVSIPPFSHLRQGWQEDTALMDILCFLQDKVLGALDVRQAVRDHYNQAACRPNQLATLSSGPRQSAGASTGGVTGSDSGAGAGGMCGGQPGGHSQAPQNITETLRRVQTYRNCLSVATSG